MSAANMDLNVQTLDQIGGALQKLNADGTVDQAGTQQVLAALQQQLGTNFTQTAVSDNLHTDFVKDGGGLPTFMVAAIAIAASIVTAGAAAAALGVELAAMSLPMAMTVGALSAMAGSAAGQLASGQGFNFGQMLEAGATGALTAGAFSALGAGTQGLQQIGSNIANGTASATEVGQALGTIAERGLVTAGIDTAVYGGSFGRAFENSVIADAGVVGASAIGTEFNGQNGNPDPSSPLYVASHAALGCALSSASGTGCVGGAIGGAASAIVAPDVIKAIDPTGVDLTTGQTALVTAISTLVGGGIASAAGQNVQGAVSAAQNEALNNSTQDPQAAAKSGGLAKALIAAAYTLMPWLPGNPAGQAVTSVVLSNAKDLVGQIPSPNGPNPPSTGAAPVTVCDPPFCYVSVSPGWAGGPSSPLLSKGGDNGEGELEGSTGSSATGQAPATNSTAAGPFSTYDTSITNAGSEYLNVKTNVTADQFESNLISNGYSVTNQGTNKNGSFTVLNNGTSTYTIYTRTTTGQAGGQYFGPGGVSAKFSLNPR